MAGPQDKGAWLKTSTEQGYNVYCRMQGAVVISESALGNFTNLMISGLTGLPVFFTSPNQWVSSIIMFPFSLPLNARGSDKYYLKLGPLDTAGYEDNKKVECYEAIFPTVNFLQDMGSYYIPRHFNNFLDYTGYTNISVFLPYYGYVEIQPNEVLDKYIFVKLYIDYYSGQGMYYICVGDTADADTGDMRILSKQQVQIGINVAIGSSNATEIKRNIALGSLKLATAAVGAYALSQPSTTRTISTTVKKSKQPTAGGTEKFKTDYKKTTKSETTTESKKLGGVAIAASCMSSGISSLNNAFTASSSAVTNNTTLDSVATNYVHIIIKRPKVIADSSDYTKLYGKPAGYTAKLNTLTGFTKISNVHLTGFDEATNDEINEIEERLKNGIII